MNQTRYISVDDLQAQTTLHEAAAKCSVSLDVHGTGKQVRLDCPFGCPGDHAGQRELSVDTSNPQKVFMCHAYNCQFRGNLLTLMHGWVAKSRPSGDKLKGEEFKRVRNILAGEMNPPTAVPQSIPSSAPEAETPKYRNVPLANSENEKARELVTLNEKLITEVGLMPPPAAAYVRRHACLSPDVMRKWRMGVVPFDGGSDKRAWSLRGQILYPVLSEDEKLLAWVARDPQFESKEQAFNVLPAEERLKQKKPAKHRFPVDFHRGLELFGQQVGRLKEPGFRETIACCGIIIVEGFNDTIHLDSLGIPSVAIMSNKITPEQVSKVEQWAKALAKGRMTLLFDADDAGDAGAKEALWHFAQRGLDVRLGWSRAMFGGTFYGKQPEILTAQNFDGLEHLVPTVRSQLKIRRKKDVPIVPVASSVITSNSIEVQKLRARFQQLFDVSELHYIRFDMDLIGEEGLLCQTGRTPDRWPEPPVVTDYANLCDVIRSQNVFDVRTMSKQVSAYLGTGDYASAAPLVTSALVRMPRLSSMWRTFQDMHRIGAIPNTECDSILKTILDSDPENSYAHEWHAIRSLEEAEEPSSPEVDDAARELERAIRQSPERRELLRLIATVASARGDFKRALSATKAARDGEPANVQASLDIAYYNVRLRGPYLAVAAEELESVVSSSSFLAHLWLSYLLAFLGREAEARELLAKSEGISNVPEDIKSYPLRLAEAQLDLITGKINKAASQAVKVLSNVGRQAKHEAHNWIELLICAGYFEEATGFLTNMKGSAHKKPLLLLSRYLSGDNDTASKENVLKAWSRVQGWSFFELLLARERIATEKKKNLELAKRFDIVEDLIRQHEFLVGIRQRVGIGTSEEIVSVRSELLPCSGPR